VARYAGGGVGRRRQELGLRRSSTECRNGSASRAFASPGDEGQSALLKSLGDG
jgi:hypothetical protein